MFVLMSALSVFTSSDCDKTFPSGSIYSRDCSQPKKLLTRAVTVYFGYSDII